MSRVKNYMEAKIKAELVIAELEELIPEQMIVRCISQGEAYAKRCLRDSRWPKEKNIKILGAPEKVSALMQRLVMLEAWCNLLPVEQSLSH